MSYSVLLRYADTGDNLVTLNQPTMQELKTKIPLYNLPNFKKTYSVQFNDADGIEIEDNDDLQTAFNEHGKQNLLIKVTTIEKNKNKNTKHGNNTRSTKGGLGSRRDRHSYPNDPRRNDRNSKRNYQNNQYSANPRNQYQGNQPHHGNRFQGQQPNRFQGQQQNRYQGQQQRNYPNNQYSANPQNRYQANQPNHDNRFRAQQPNRFRAQQAHRPRFNNNNNFNPNKANYNNYNNKRQFHNNNNHNRNNQHNKPYQRPYKAANVDSKPFKQNAASQSQPSSSPSKSWKKLTILPYRWQRKQVKVKQEENHSDDMEQEGKIQITGQEGSNINDVAEVDSNWVSCSYEESKQYEQQFNSDNKALPNEFEALGGFRRIIRFQGKVIKILQKQTMGFVEPNYPQQIDIGVAFYYGDFINERINNSNPLRKGYKLEYSLKFFSTPPKYAGFRAFDIKIISRDIPAAQSMPIAAAQSMPNISELNVGAAAAEEEATNTRDEPPAFEVEPGQISSAKLNRYIDRVQEVNIKQQRGLIWSTKLNTLLGFDLDACTEVDIEKGCFVEYCVENAKATKVTFVILDYKWREFNNFIKKWNKCTYQQCVDYENMYNKNHLNMESELNLNGKRLKRYTRFQGKIKRINAEKRMGYVQYGVKYNVLFEFDECDFDASFLNKGDMISYEIERDEDENGVPNLKCVTVKFLPIRFLWREKAMKGDGEWTNCSVQKSRQLESKYYQRKNKHNIVEHAANTKYSRTLIFCGHISLSDGTIQFDLDDTYKNIKVDYAAQECKNQSLNEGDAVQFKLINTEQGVCKAIDLSKPGESKRKCGIITRVDKKKRIGYLTPYDNVCGDTKEDNNEYMFFFNECNGVNPNFIPNGTRMEYELRYFTPTYKAVNVCLYLLPYQWLGFDAANAIWKPHSIETAKQFEKIYNSSPKKNNLQFKIDDNMRVKVFQSKIREIRPNGGLVEINYNDEIKNLRIYFDFKELQFDGKCLQRGDEISYELRKVNYPKPQWKIVNIQFAKIIPFYWMTMFKQINNKRQWFNVPFRQNFDLERKYNSANDVKFETQINDASAGKQYRRHTRFRGNIISLPTKNKPAKITVFYDKLFNNLLVDVDGKCEEIEKKAEYHFDIVANEKGLPGFKAINMKEKVTYNKQIFVQLYQSKLIDVDITNKIGKLETPSKLLRLLNKNNKAIWYWQLTDEDSDSEDGDGGGTPCDSALCDKLDKLKVGETCTDPIVLFNSSTIIKLSVNLAEDQNTLTGFKRTFIKKQAVSASDEFLSFDLFQCKGFHANKVNKHCILEYKVTINKKYKKDDDDEKSMQVSRFKAINVRIPMVFYRWQKYDGVSFKWKAESREISIQYEEKYNKDRKVTDAEIVTDKKERIRRIIRFRGKILKIDRVSKRGQVRINYSKEYGKEIGVWFDFRACRFNPNYLRIGDSVEYNLRGNIAVNVKLWLIPFRYIYKLSDDDNKEDDNWKEFTYHQCKELEQKFNSDGGECKDFEYSFNNTLVTVRRTKTFKSKAIFDRYNRNACYLSIGYCGKRNLGIRVLYTLKNNDNIRHGNYVQFELKRNAQTRNWKLENIKKIKYENKQVLQLKKELEELKKNMNDINNNTRIEHKWKWKDDDGSFNIYNPDISNKLNKQRIGQTFLFSTASFKYTITKLSDDSGKQTNNTSQRDREMKRFTIRKTINDDDTPGAGFAIPDGEFYQNVYNKLIDDEIKQLFYATVGEANAQIIEIEEVVISRQNRLYELNLWDKCDELKRTRDEVEKYLWHGSHYDTINVIIQNGFDRSYSTIAAYGNGTYFARDARYSVGGYCHQHSDGYKYILLCKVIVGDSTRGSSSIKKVPLKADQTEYDTLVDNTDNPSIYVVWRDYTAIPVFRIKFKST